MGLGNILRFRKAETNPTTLTSGETTSTAKCECVKKNTCVTIDTPTIFGIIDRCRGCGVQKFTVTQGDFTLSFDLGDSPVR